MEHTQLSNSLALTTSRMAPFSYYSALLLTRGPVEQINIKYEFFYSFPMIETGIFNGMIETEVLNQS